ncbi:MAG: hypothetical protein KA712_06420 [Myxococcales bacterium]|nr:hypothetical protein [Myxococcales bacterium]
MNDRFRCLACAVALGAAALSVAGQAYGQETVVSRGDRYRSPKNWAMELHLGPYRPNIDSEFGNLPEDERPFALYFGDDRRLMARAELDYQIWNGFGSVGLGVSVGYTRQSAKAFVEPEPGALPETRSGDDTKLMLLPTSVSLVYRFDVLALRWSLPLVPYAKAGFDWVYWSISNGNGDVARDAAGNRGRGGTSGYHLAAGLSILLDVFDPGSAQAFDAETGVNHTYAFAEYRHAVIDGLGSANRLHVGDSTWSAGLMFEF